jgi:hypothetical protein
MTKRVMLLFLLIVTFTTLAYGQITPAPPAAPTLLPGYTLQISAGYSSAQGVQGSNGFFSTLEAPLYTRAGKYDLTFSARADYNSLSTPSNFVLAAGPEVRTQFSSAKFLNGIVLQPYGDVLLGATRAQCVSANDCAVGVDVKSHFATKFGFGVDMPVGSGTTVATVARLFEVQWIHAKPFGTITESNFAQVSAGLGFRF